MLLKGIGTIIGAGGGIAMAETKRRRRFGWPRRLSKAVAILGGIVVVAGFAFDHADFAAALLEHENRDVPTAAATPFDAATFLAAAAILFASFIGFDSIAQAGGEARNPGRNLPLAIGIAIVSVGSFYFLFTAAV